MRPQPGELLLREPNSLLPSSPFVTAARSRSAGGGDGAGTLVWLVAYDRAEYRPRLYDHYGLRRPEGIARSVASRQSDYLAGRIAARLALDALGAGPADVPQGERREPCWPPGIVGSISHTRRLAAATAARGGLVGIDVEEVLTPARLAAVLESSLSPAERRRLQRLQPDAPLDRLVTVAFSAKESFYKAVFPVVRAVLPFDAVEIVAFEPAEGRLAMTIARTLCAQLPAGRRVEARFQDVGRDTLLTSVILP